jgi:hypothetical protein
MWRIGIDQNQVRFLADLDRPDVRFEPERPCAVPGRHPEHVTRR